MNPPLLANENMPQPSVEYLRAEGFDVLAVAEGNVGAGDGEILKLAAEQRRWEDSRFRKRPLPSPHAS